MFWWSMVEPQGVEPWSREDDNVRSTCLVDFGFRTKAGRQRPTLILVAVFSTAMRNTQRPSSCIRHRFPIARDQARGTKAWAMMASTDLISG